MNILKINSSVQDNNTSVTRQLVEKVIAQISTGETNVVDRDLTIGVPFVTGPMIGAFHTPADQQSAEQKELIAASDALVQEIKDADVLVLGVPIYNFSVPGSMKAYFDLLARVGITFQYSEQGPKGLIEGKKAYIVVASGGTGFQTGDDYASNYVKHFLGFIGIKDVEFINATGLMFGAEDVLKRANAEIEALGTVTV